MYMYILAADYMRYMYKLMYTVHVCFLSEPMDVDSNKASSAVDHPSSLVQVLRGHSSEVFTCAWSPVANILVTGSEAEREREIESCNVFLCKILEYLHIMRTHTRWGKHIYTCTCTCTLIRVSCIPNNKRFFTCDCLYMSHVLMYTYMCVIQPISHPHVLYMLNL